MPCADRQHLITAAKVAGLITLAACCLLFAGVLVPAAGGGRIRGTLDLRVIANSNSPGDQSTKLAVRDAVLAAVAPGLAAARTDAAATTYVQDRLPDLAAVASAVAGRAGQTATVRLGPEAFPARRIGFLAFPAGRAQALVITLGSGQGHNWWTVLFPPLALVTVDGHLVVVGPQGSTDASDLSPAQRQRLLAWVAGKTGVPLDGQVVAGGPAGAAGETVQIRLAAWVLLQHLPLDLAQRTLATWRAAF